MCLNKSCQPKEPVTSRCQVKSYLQLCLFYLQLVFVAYGKLAWSFLLTVEI